MHEPDPSINDPSPEAVDTARRHARRFRKGVLRADDEIIPCAFVIDGEDGRLVMPTDDEIWDAVDLVLYVPDDGFAEMALLIDAERFDEPFAESKDRHLAYHGRAEGLHWVRARVESAKWGGEIFPGDRLLGPNPLRAVEPGLCRRLNEDKAALAEVSELLTRVRPETPLCVGVDHLGMDVRTRVGVIRVEWPREIESEDSAPGVVEALLTGSLE